MAGEGCAMPLRSRGLIVVRLVLLSFTLATVGCTATYIKASVKDNPLDRVAERAKEEWAVERVDQNTLHLRDSWPIISALSFGYSASYVTMVYNEVKSELDLQYYFKTFQLITLYIPYTIDAEPGLFGAAMKPTMNEQIYDLLNWSGATIKRRRSGLIDEPFPQ